MVFIFGTNGDDNPLNGTGGRDLIFGRRGDDVLNGFDGNDWLFGGRGHDILNGGDGRDWLFGGRGDDILNGGDGRDRLFGGRGHDILNGGDGRDRLFGGRGDDTLSGDGGNDYLSGGRGTDTAFFSGDVRDYDFTPSWRGRLSVDHARGDMSDGTDALRGIEILQFSNFTVYLDGSNSAPFADDDSADAMEDGPAVVIDVMSDDFDFEGDTLGLVSLDTTGTVGAVSIIDPVAGTVEYDPGAAFQFLAEGETTTDTFDYTITDGTSLATATVTVTITGKAEGFGPVLELSDIENGDGSLGFVLNGVSADDISGRSVSSAGDVNGDGLDDVIIGAPSIDPFGTSSGVSFVVFGSANDVTGGDGKLELSDIETGDGSLGFVLNGISLGDQSGYSVSSAGDVNGDGLDDVIIGAYADDPNGSTSGASFVVFGSATDITGGDGRFELSDIETGDGSLGFVLNGISASDLIGQTVSSAGDVNGDGFDDLVIGSRTYAAHGSAFVVFGSAGDITGGDGVFELSEIENGNGDLGFVLNGLSISDNAGWSVSSAGDINGDGIADLIVGAPADDPNGPSSGASFVVFGSATDITGGDGVLELSDIENGDGSLGFVVNGVSTDDRSGFSVSAAGDVNGDGFDDLIVGAPGDGPSGNGSGASFVIFGSAADLTGGNGNFELSDIENGDGSLGFVLNGVSAYDTSGFSVSAAGDVNGDGFDDVITSAIDDDPNGNFSGASFVVFGSATDITGGDGVFELSDIENGDGSLGFVLNGVSEGDISGWSVSSAGDVNGDGFDDLIVGARGDDPNGESSGAIFVVFGGNFTNAVNVLGTEGADNLMGTAGADIIIAKQGDDTITGNGGDDRMTGALGDDLFVFNDGDGNDVVVDFVAGAGSDDVLDVQAFGFANLASVLTASAQIGDDVMIALDGDDSVTLLDTELADLHADDFMFV